MKELYLTDTEALVLEQILETVREVYNCLGHSEWSGDGDENRVTDAEADKAIDDMLNQLDHQPSSYDKEEEASMETLCLMGLMDTKED